VFFFLPTSTSYGAVPLVADSDDRPGEATVTADNVTAPSSPDSSSGESLGAEKDQ
jgi:hypothetical protein